MTYRSFFVERGEVNKASLQERPASCVSLCNSAGCRLMATVECRRQVGTRVQAEAGKP